MYYSKIYFYILVAALLLSNVVNAQSVNFRWQAEIQAVQQNGFYSLALSPAITGKSAQTHFEDIRIWKERQEMPYIIREKKLQVNSSFDSLPLLSYIQDGTKHSVLTIGNPKKRQLDHLLITMNNATTDKQIQLSGSYDQQKWYVVKEQYALSTTIVNRSGTEMLGRVEIPKTSYPFYQMRIADSSAAPLYIHKVGLDTLQIKETSSHLDKVPTPKVKEITSTVPLHSLWQISFDADYPLQQLSFVVKEPTLFRREVLVLQKQGQKTTGARRSPPYRKVGSGVLSPENLRIWLDEEVKTSELFVEVTNGNSIPLRFAELAGWQKQYELLTYLEAGNSYRLVVGSKHVGTPRYDLGYFENVMQGHISPLHIEAFQEKQTALEKKGFELFGSAYWLWAGLVFVVALLLWMSGKMLREMKGK